MISENRYNYLNLQLLIIILSTILYRPINTILIIIFIIFNLLNYKYLTINKENLRKGFYLFIPLLLYLIFIWNNQSILEGFNKLEKMLSFLVFPFFLILNYKNIDIKKILKGYQLFFSLFILVVLIRFLVIKPDYVLKYINGNELWEMGYVIANSFKSHAPAVNMHIAYLISVNFFLLLISKQKIVSFILLFFSIFALFIFNTRASLGTSILMCILIYVFYAYKKYDSKFIYYLISFVSIIAVIISISFYSNPYMKEKYSKVTFSNMDKIGRLDEVENPDEVLHNALVTRISIWESTLKLSKERLIIGFGSADNKNALIDYYKRTNQQFLYKNEFPVHNQFLDYLLKFGLIGLATLLYFFYKNYKIAIKTKNVLFIAFLINFVISNLFDDFLIRFDGIVFSAIWMTLGFVYYLKFQSESK